MALRGTRDDGAGEQPEPDEPTRNRLRRRGGAMLAQTLALSLLITLALHLLLA